MSNRLVIPKNYDPMLDQIETQRAIKKIKDYFQQELAYGLQLRRVSAPLFVQPETGLNDNLNGTETRALVDVFFVLNLAVATWLHQAITLLRSSTNK